MEGGGVTSVMKEQEVPTYMEDLVCVLATAPRAICVRLVLQYLNCTVMTFTLFTTLFLEGERERSVAQSEGVLSLYNIMSVGVARVLPFCLANIACTWLPSSPTIITTAHTDTTEYILLSM